jgi:hypothetical protein
MENLPQSPFVHVLSRWTRLLIVAGITGTPTPVFSPSSGLVSRLFAKDSDDLSQGAPLLHTARGVGYRMCVND